MKSRNTGNYPVYDFKKAMFLVLTGNKPVSTALEDGRTVFWFDDLSRPYTRVWHTITDAAIEASKNGLPLTPDQLDTMQSDLWGQLDDYFSSQEAGN